MKRVLIVDDSLYMRTMIKDALSEEGYEIVGEAGDGETALQLAQKLNPEVITLDNVLPDMMGLDILKTLNEMSIPSKVVMVSAVGQRTMVEKGKDLGAADYIVKPFTEEVLVETVNRISQ